MGLIVFFLVTLYIHNHESYRYKLSLDFQFDPCRPKGPPLVLHGLKQSPTISLAMTCVEMTKDVLMTV